MAEDLKLFELNRRDIQMMRVQGFSAVCQEAYWKLVEAMSRMEETVLLKITHQEQLSLLMRAVRCDYPEVTVFFEDFKVLKTSNKEGWIIQLNYFCHRKKALRVLKKIERQAERIVECAIKQQMSERMIAKKICRYILKNYQICEPDEDEFVTLVSILKRKATTTEMTLIYHYILRQLQIPSVFLNGYYNTQSRVWVMFKAEDGKEYCVDFTKKGKVTEIGEARKEGYFWSMK